jgi:hypothetical protein
MKKNKTPFYPQISLICTDGSTIQTNFLQDKDDIYLNPDLKSNALWLPYVEKAGLKVLSSRLQKYDFNFESLILQHRDKNIL